MTALFVLIAASFPSDTEAEQDGGGQLACHRQCQKKPRELVSSSLSVASPGVHLRH